MCAAIITGGMGTVGKELAKKLIQKGIKGVTLLDSYGPKGKEVIDEINSKWGMKKVSFIETDTTKPEEVEAAFKETAEKYKNIDYIINAAGVIDEINWETTIDVNFIGTTYCTKIGYNFIKKYKSGFDGTILNISSNLAMLPLPRAPIFCAASQCLVGLGRNMGTEKNYELHRTKLITVCLGLTNTKFMKTVENSFAYDNCCLDKQEPEQVAEQLTIILKKAKNGQIYEIDQGKISILEMPKVMDLIIKE